MGLFSGFKNTIDKSVAAVVVQNLLEDQARLGLFDLHPGQYANKLVQAVWSQRPEYFDGRFGQKPHKISTAAVALAAGTKLLPPGANRDSVTISLGRVLSELERNAALYPLNTLDHKLIEIAVAAFAEMANEAEDSMPAGLDHGG